MRLLTEICALSNHSYTESAQPTPMDISQENVEADSLSCPESDSLLIPSTTSSRPPAVEDLPRDADDAVAAAASRAEAPIAKELDALSIDVVESWRIVAPAAPTSHSAPPSDAWKGAATANQGFADEKVLGDNKNDFVSPASERGAFDVYRLEDSKWLSQIFSDCLRLSQIVLDCLRLGRFELRISTLDHVVTRLHMCA